MVLSEEQKNKSLNRLRRFLIEHRVELIIFAVALAARLLSLAFILWREQQLGGFFREFGTFSFPVLPKDSTEYYVLAKNLLNFGQFSLSGEAPFSPDSFRTPVYPAFLAAVIYVFKSVLSVSIVQGILGALSAVLFYKTAKKFFSTRISAISALIFAFEPNVLYFTNTIASEPLFLFLFMLALYLFLDKGGGGRRPVFLAAGFILGLAILTRPLIQFLPLLFMAMILYWGKSWGWKKTIMAAAFFLLGIAITVFPWSLRNKIFFDSWQISSVGPLNFYNYYLPMFVAQKSGLSLDSVMADYKSRALASGQVNPADYFGIVNAPYFIGAVKQEVIKEPLAFSRFYLLKSVPFFVSDGFRDMARFLEYIGPPTTNLTDSLLKGNFSEISKSIFSGNLEFNLFLFGFTFWSAITFFMLFGAWHWAISAKPDKVYCLFIFLLIIYFFMASGPIANGRFRLPVVPWMAALALYGLIWVGRLFKKIPLSRSAAAEFFSLDLEG